MADKYFIITNDDDEIISRASCHGVQGNVKPAFEEITKAKYKETSGCRKTYKNGAITDIIEVAESVE